MANLRAHRPSDKPSKGPPNSWRSSPGTCRTFTGYLLRHRQRRRVLTQYSPRTHKVLAAYSPGTCCGAARVLTRYSQRTHQVLATCSPGTCCGAARVLTRYLMRCRLRTHQVLDAVPPVHSPGTCCALTRYFPRTHQVLAAHSPGTCCGVARRPGASAACGSRTCSRRCRTRSACRGTSCTSRPGTP